MSATALGQAFRPDTAIVRAVEHAHAAHFGDAGEGVCLSVDHHGAGARHDDRPVVGEARGVPEDGRDEIATFAVDVAVKAFLRGGIGEAFIVGA
ncbi:hypothetical protein CH311_10650 [Afifella marina DSM 2698]|nr:hypothetical protein CH311_10650 [Afifella marina DSM 2698]